MNRQNVCYDGGKYCWASEGGKKEQFQEVRIFGHICRRPRVCIHDCLRLSRVCHMHARAYHWK